MKDVLIVLALGVGPLALFLLFEHFVAKPMQKEIEDYEAETERLFGPDGYYTKLKEGRE